MKWKGVSLPVQAFVDSGAATDFMDFDMIKRLDIKQAPGETHWHLYHR